MSEIAGVSHGTMSAIEYIQEKAVPELVDAVRTGKIKIDAAAQVATLSAEEQSSIAAQGTDALKMAAKGVRKAKSMRAGPMHPKPAAHTKVPRGETTELRTVSTSEELDQLEKQYLELQEKHRQVLINLASVLEDKETMSSVVAANNSLPATFADATQYRDLQEATQAQLDACMAENAELLRLLNKLQQTVAPEFTLCSVCNVADYLYYPAK